MKRVLSSLLLILLLIPAAHAQGASLRLEESSPTKEQFKAFRAYLGKLPAKDREAWMAELSLLCAENPGAAIAPADEAEEKVWIAGKGKKYHSRPGCSGMKSPIEIPLREAQGRGLSPCKRCYK